MRKFLSTVKGKLTLTVAATVLFFAVVLVVLTYGLMKDSAERTAAELADTVLEEADTHVTKFFENMEEIARALAAHRAVYDVDVEALRELVLTNVWSRRDYMRAIYLGTESGAMHEWGYGEGFVDNSPTFPPDYDPRIRPWYREAMAVDAFAVTDPYLYASIDEYGITCVLPVYHPSGDLVGVLGLDIMLDALQSLISDFDISKGGRVYITDRLGAPLVDQFAGVADDSAPPFTWEGGLKGTSGRFIADSAGVAHFVSYTQNPVTGWTIYVGLPVPAVMASTYSAIRLSIALNLLLMILLLIALEWSSRQLVIEPIERMAATIGRIRTGDGTARIDVHREDELGTLARSFNALADTVESYTFEMEQKVRERTERLQRLQQENLRLRIIEEKERIYGYLHDSLGSRLTNIVISNNVARSAASDPPVRIDMHDRIEENAQAGLNDLKEILSGSLDSDRMIVDFRLVIELQIRRRLELKHISFTLDGEVSDLDILPRETAMELEKTFQELTSNVLKHANATSVFLTIRSEERYVVVTFRDNGRGFDIAGIPPDSFGILNLRHRIERLGGLFSVTSAREAGTTVVLKIPGEGDDDERD